MEHDDCEFIGSEVGKTWEFGVNLAYELLKGGVYGQQSWAGVSDVSFPGPAVELNVMIPTTNCGAARCKYPRYGLRLDR